MFNYIIISVMLITSCFSLIGMEPLGAPVKAPEQASCTANDEKEISEQTSKSGGSDDAHANTRQKPVMVPLQSGKKELTHEQYNNLIKRVSAGPARHIGKEVIRTVEMKAYRYREALLPALFTWFLNGEVARLNNYIDSMRTSLMKNYRDNQAAARQLPAKTILSVAFARKRLTNYAHIINRNLQDATANYEQLIGYKLAQADIALVGYADGTYDIKISDIDRDAANNLSHEQIDFIVALGQSPDTAQFVSREPYASRLSSLPFNMQQNLANNYSFTLPTYAISESENEAKNRALQQQLRESYFSSERRTLYTYAILASATAFTLGWLGKTYWRSIYSYLGGQGK